MNLKDMMDLYYEEGLTRELASARVCQDILAIMTAVFHNAGSSEHGDLFPVQIHSLEKKV